MSIFGIGTDIVSVDRIKNSLKNKNFINRIFSKKEIQKCKKINNSNNCFAKRFAAKEAFSKAMGTGFRGEINLQAISVKHDEMGKPSFDFNNNINDILIKQKITCQHLSISDEKNIAVAFVILDKS